MPKRNRWPKQNRKNILGNRSRAEGSNKKQETDQFVGHSLVNTTQHVARSSWSVLNNIPKEIFRIPPLLPWANYYRL